MGWARAAKIREGATKKAVKGKIAERCLARIEGYMGAHWAKEADQQKATGNLSTHGGESLGLLQEGDHFLQFLLGLANELLAFELLAGAAFASDARARREVVRKGRRVARSASLCR